RQGSPFFVVPGARTPKRRDMSEDSIDDPRSRWVIQVRLLRRDIDAPDTRDDERGRLQEQLDTLIDVPPQLQHTRRLKDLTTDQLIRLSQANQAEEDLEPLPSFVDWPRDQSLPTGRALVVVLWRVLWSEGNRSEKVGCVQVHTSDAKDDSVVGERGEV